MMSPMDARITYLLKEFSVSSVSDFLVEQCYGKTGVLHCGFWSGADIVVSFFLGLRQIAAWLVHRPVIAVYEFYGKYLIPIIRTHH